MRYKDPDIPHIHFEDTEMECDGDLSLPLCDRVLFSTQSTATLYGQIKGVTVKKPVLKTVPG